MRKIILAALLLITTTFSPVRADSWGPPREKDYLSENGKFVAHVTPGHVTSRKPPKQNTKPLLAVFEIKDTERVPLWHCVLGNEVAPVQAYISNDGQYVVTANDWGGAGYGDHVLAFYGKDGPIKNYSLKEILHLPEKTDLYDLNTSIPMTASSIWWNQYSIMFFDEHGGQPVFCIWLSLFDRWITWQLSNGQEIQGNEQLVKRLSQETRQQVLTQIKKGTEDHTPYVFLGKLKNPQDRPIIEALLSDQGFTSSTGYIEISDDGDRPDRSWNYHAANSYKRDLAECLLAQWDGKPTESPDSDCPNHQAYYHLAIVEGVVKLPRAPRKGHGSLWIYLIPQTVPRDTWQQESPVHRLQADFGDDFDFTYDDRKPGRKLRFYLEGVTPGSYWLKVVWDKAKPYSEPNAKVAMPQRGDYQSLDSPTITVKAGQRVEGVVVKCNKRVGR